MSLFGCSSSETWHHRWSGNLCYLRQIAMTGPSGDQAVCRENTVVSYCVQWTNVSKDFKGTLDYIFYTHESLVPIALLELPEDSTVQKTKNSGLPNEHWSSDHIALMAEFAYRQQR